MAHRSSSSSPLLILWKRNDSNVNLVIEYSDFIYLCTSIANKSGKYVLYAAARQMSNFVFYKILVVMEENRECLFRIKKTWQESEAVFIGFFFLLQLSDILFRWHANHETRESNMLCMEVVQYDRFSFRAPKLPKIAFSTLTICAAGQFDYTHCSSEHFLLMLKRSFIPETGCFLFCDHWLWS